MKKFLLWLVGAGLGLVIVLMLVLVLARNGIARKSVEVGVHQITGFPLAIGSVTVGLFNGQLDVHDVILLNPAEFPDQRFVDMPHLFIDYRLRSVLARSPHINDMVVNINQLVFVKNAQGESNVTKLKGVKSADKPSTAKYRVDRLSLHVGTVIVKDYSQAKPSEHTFHLNIDATYKDITDATDINRLVLLTVMSQVHLPDIGIKVDDLKKGLGNVTDAAGQAVKGAVDAVDKAGKGVWGTLRKVVPQQP